jgi:hypothetical protein
VVVDLVDELVHFALSGRSRRLAAHEQVMALVAAAHGPALAVHIGGGHRTGTLGAGGGFEDGRGLLDAHVQLQKS